MQQLTTIAKALALAQWIRGLVNVPSGGRLAATASSYAWALVLATGLLAGQAYGQCAPNDPIVIEGVIAGEEGRNNIIQLIPLVSGGSGTYNYSWEDPNANDVFITGATTLPIGGTAGDADNSSQMQPWHSVVGLPITPYTVTLTVDDAINAGCSATVTFTVENDPDPNNVVFTFTGEACVGESVTYSVPTGNYTYAWSAAPAIGTYTGGANTASEEISWNADGTANFSVVVTTNSGTSPQPVYATINYEIEVGALPTVAAGALTICPDLPGGTEGTFTLSDADGQVDVGGGNTVTYHANQVDADAGTNALPNAYFSGSGTVVARVENPVTGCYSTANVTLTVQDVNPPTATPLTVTVQLDASGNISVAPSTLVSNVNDDCVAVPQLVISSPSVLTYDCDDAGQSFNVTVNISDGTNTAPFVATVNVVDDIAPVFDAFASQTITINCEDDDTPANTGTPTATDNCAAPPVISFSDAIAAGACANERVITRTWTADDGNGNTTDLVQTITVVDNTLPVLANVPLATTVDCSDPLITTPAGGTGVGGAATGGVTATDNCSAAGNITLAVADAITPGNCANEYTITRTWTATDECGNVATADQVITVTDNVLPTLANVPANTTVECDDPIIGLLPAGPSDGATGLLGVTASDNCSAAASVSLSVADAIAPGNCANEYVITRTWTATDECGNVATADQVITVEDNTAPTLAGIPGTIAVSCDNIPALPAGGFGDGSGDTGGVTATDNCSAPASIAISVADAITPGLCVNTYTITRTWTATDECGLLASATQTINVSDNTGPVLAGIPNAISVDCANIPPLPPGGNGSGGANTGGITATDNCSAPANIAIGISDAITAGACVNSYVITRTWTATDECGNSTSQSQTITVTDNTLPVLANVPANTTVDCADPLINTPTGGNGIGGPNTGGVTATDNCSLQGDITIAVADVTSPGNCPNEYTITRTWTATDECGNVATADQVITVTDNVLPTLANVPANTTVECDDPIIGLLPAGPSDGAAGLLGVTASDNCSADANVSLSVADAITPGNCLNEYVITRTWTATDECGNVATADQVITVEDNTLPVLTCPANVSVNADPGQCGATITNLIATATDNCGGTITIANDAFPAGAADASGFYPVGTTTVTFTATDACGNVATCSTTVEVIDNQIPTIACPTDVTVSNDQGQCGAVVSGIAPTSFADNCPGAVVTYSITGALTGAGSNDASGTFFPVGTSTVTYTITDAANQSATCSFTVTVEDTEAPVLSCPSNITVSTDPGSCTAIVNFNVTAVDNCDGTLTPVQTVGASSGSAFNIGEEVITFEVTDLAGNTSTCTFTVTVEDNELPVVLDCPADITVNSDPGVCEAAVTVPVPAFGPNGNFNDNCPNLVTITNDYTGTNDASGTYPVGTTQVVWTISDGSGNQASCTQLITVNDAENPTLACPALVVQGVDQGICGAIVTGIDPTFGDNCPTPTLAYTLTGATTGSGTGSASGTLFAVGTTTVTYTVTDGASNSVDCSFTVTINDDENPVIQCPANQVVNNDLGACSAVVTGIAPLVATDNCPGATVTYTLSGATTGSGTTDASGETFALGTTTVEYTITDAANNVLSCSFTVTVEDTENPTLLCPADVVTNNDAGVCGAAVADIAPVTATDNCPGLTVDYTLTGATTGSGQNDASGTVFNVGVTTVTYTATDAANNVSTCSFTVTVNDTEPPSIVCPDDIVVDNDQGVCGAQVIFLQPGVFDNCPNATLVQTAGPASGSVFPIGTTTVTFTATDASNNSVSCSFTVTVNDTESPQVSCVPDVSVGVDQGVCGATVNGIAPTISDNCPNPTVEYSLTGATVATGSGDASGLFFELGETTVTYTVTDASNNVSSCSFTVTVVDDEDPTLSCPANVLTNTDPGECAKVVTGIEPTFGDNCPGATLTYSLTGATIGSGTGSAEGLSFEKGTTTVTYTVTDGANNVASCSFTVDVIDNEDPILTCPDDLVVANDLGLCDATVTGIDPVFSDNCPNPVLSYTLTGATTGSGTGSASGEIFALGTTTVTYTVTDEANNTASCSFTVTVEDDEDPVVFCPGTSTVPLGSNGQVVLNNLPIFFSDNCGVDDVSISPNVLTCADIGPNLITVTVTDFAGNFSTCSFTVNLIDNQPPQLVCPADVVVANDPGLCSAEVAGIAPQLVGDNCNLESVTYELTGATTGSGANDASLTTFNVGVTTVTYTATDAQGQVSTCSFTVTVNDVEQPLITCPAPVTVSTDQGACSATVTGLAPTFSDNCDANAVLSYSLAGATVGSGTGEVSGLAFNLGVTTVTYTVTDASNNSASCSFDVTVEDNTPPVLSCPQDVVVDATQNCEAIVTGIGPLQAFDNCDNAPVLTYELTGATVGNGTGDANGLTFALGITTVTYTLTDVNGNESDCSFTVTVEDNLDPVIACPADIEVVSAQGECGAVVSYQLPVGTDNCPNPITTQIAGLGSGATFPVGVTTETYQVIDASGNITTCSFTVTVLDEEDPTIVCPADVVVNVDPGQCGAVVDYPGVSIADNCPNPDVALISGLGDGAFFPVGVTTEEYQVTDASGNTATCSFTVTVVDNEAPVVNCPVNVVVDNEAGLCGATVTGLTPSIVENCPTVTTTYVLSGATTGTGTNDASGTFFNVGETVVAYTVTDGANNTTTCSFTVTVNDVEAPVLVCPDDVVVNIPNSQNCEEIVTYPGVQATDNCPGAVTISLVEGLASGEAFPIGVTTVVYEGIDLAGNVATCSFTVTVNGPSDVTAAQISTPNLEICEGDTAILEANAPGTGEAAMWTASAGGTFLPSNMDPVASLADLPPGLNIITWTITNGCAVSTATMEIQVNPKPSGLIFEVNPISAWNVQDGVLQIVGIDGTPPEYAYEWSNGATTNINSNLGPDEYWVIVTDAAGCTSDTLFYELTAPPAPTVLVDVKVMLGGAYNEGTGLMNDGLRTLPDFPTTEPYTGLGFTHLFGGGETIMPALLNKTGDSAVVDWVFLELRDPVDPTVIISTRSALLLRNGAVVDVDGSSPVSIVGTPGSYHVAVRHRNHLGAMTLNPVALDVTQPATTVDFIDPAGTPTFGTDALDPPGFVASVRRLWAGDANGDGLIIYAGSPADVTPVAFLVFTDPGNTTGSPTYVVFGYDQADLNMNGNVIYAGSPSEISVIALSVFLHPVNLAIGSPTYVIQQQLP